MLFLSGCDRGSQLSGALEFRNRLLDSNGCTFQANITADYGENIYRFSLLCCFDQAGTMSFEVLSPDTIKGITGTVSKEQGALTFDDEVLLFELLADDQLTPVNGPWVLMNALRSGYIQCCGKDGNNLKVMLDDSYDENAFHVDVWLSQDLAPVTADIFWQNRRILAIEIASFSYL